MSAYSILIDSIRWVKSFTANQDIFCTYGTEMSGVITSLPIFSSLQDGDLNNKKLQQKLMIRWSRQGLNMGRNNRARKLSVP